MTTGGRAAYLISCGGTGGHLAPGIALAQELQSRGHAVTLLISHKAVDAQLAAKYPTLEFRSIPGAPLLSSPAGLARFVMQQSRGVLAAVGLIRRLRPAAIIGFGGFTTAAVIVVGAAAGVPVALHEANRIPGRAIRLMAPFARRVYLPAGVSLRGGGGSRVRAAGLPVRAEIRREPRAEACAAFQLDPARPVVAVLGGSQGATPLNAWAEQAAPTLANAGVQLCCVTGGGKGGDRALSLPGPDGAAVAARFLPFCDRMGLLLSAADLVVSRAGAGTIAELIRCRVPAILVPYPFAADGHQAANAAYLAQEQAAEVLDQSGLDRLTGEVLALLRDQARREGLTRKLARLDRENPATRLADDLEELARSHRPMRLKPTPA